MEGVPLRAAPYLFVILSPSASLGADTAKDAGSRREASDGKMRAT